MTKLIDKSALVAEIKKLEESLKADCKPDLFGNVEECMTAAELQALDVVKETINTLEVKEVDLEKEFDNYTKHILACDVQFKPFTHLYNCAKHFFELGIKAKRE